MMGVEEIPNSLNYEKRTKHVSRSANFMTELYILLIQKCSLPHQETSQKLIQNRHKVNCKFR